MKIRIREILAWLDEAKAEYRFIGDESEELEGFSSLDDYRRNTLTWIKSQDKYDRLSDKPRPKLAVIQEGIDAAAENSILSDNSKEVFFGILEQFWGKRRTGERIGSNTFLSEEVKLGENVVIGSNCTLDGDIVIGSGTVIGNSVVIVNRVVIGENCEIQSLTVIGEDGFGYYEDEQGKKTMVKHFGGVEIGDNVFIGSHVNIARGVINNTVIGGGTKIAPSTHIGHNNRVGEDSTIICAKLFGSVETGREAYIVSSTVKNQCKIGEKTMVGMGSVVTRDIEAGKVAVGAPARVIRDRR